LADAEGGNALQTSVDNYGEREDTITIDVFDISVDQLGAIAQAHVMRNINPTTVRTVSQSVWRAFPIKAEDIGRLVQLPSGEQGIVVSRRYTDNYGANYATGSLDSDVDVEVVQADDQVTDPIVDKYLHLDDGSYWMLEASFLGLYVPVPSEVN